METKEKENPTPKELMQDVYVDIWHNRFKDYDAATRPKQRYGFSILLNFPDKNDPVALCNFKTGANVFEKTINQIQKLKKNPSSITLVEYTDNKPDATEINREEVEITPSKAKKTTTTKKNSLGFVPDDLKKQITEELRRDFEFENMKKELQAEKLRVTELKKELEEKEAELEEYHEQDDKGERQENIGKTIGHVVRGLHQSMPGVQKWANEKGLGFLFDESGTEGPAGGTKIIEDSGFPQDQMFYNGLIEWFKALGKGPTYQKVCALFSKLSDDLQQSESSLNAALSAVGISDYEAYMKAEAEKEKANK